jgi:ribonuclease HI
VEHKHWPYPADVASVIEVNDYEDRNIKIFTDGSKSEQGVEAGVAIFRGTELVTLRKYKLDSRCSNKQAEQLALVKAFEELETLDVVDIKQSTVAVITDSRVALDSTKNIHNHSFLIEELRLIISKLDRTNWNIVL